MWCHLVTADILYQLAQTSSFLVSCSLKGPKSSSYLPDGATWRPADSIFELRMFKNIELSSFPGSEASNRELFKKKINLTPIDLLASTQVKIPLAPSYTTGANVGSLLNWNKAHTNG